MRRSLLLLPLVLSLGGCNWFNHVTGLSKDSDKAIGAACRQTGRSLEACFVRNPSADRGQVFSGWREMQEYMAKQQLPTMQPPPDPVPPPPVVASAPPAVKTSDNAPVGDHAPVAGGGDDKSGKPDPEVQAVLDTINSRSNKNSAANPSSDEQQKLQQVLASSAQPPAPASAEPHPKKKKKG
jgi:hypothetical protein